MQGFLPLISCTCTSASLQGFLPLVYLLWNRPTASYYESQKKKPDPLLDSAVVPAYGLVQDTVYTVLYITVPYCTWIPGYLYDVLYTYELPTQVGKLPRDTTEFCGYSTVVLYAKYIWIWIHEHSRVDYRLLCAATLYCIVFVGEQKRGRGLSGERHKNTITTKSK